MKFICLLASFVIIGSNLQAQNFNGQWKGGFLDNASLQTGFGSGNIDYVLEIECTGNVVSGYSYTYFSEGSKQYFTICKLKGTVNRKTKELFVTEVERTKFNTPPDFRNCFQTHLLKYSKLNSDTEQLAGTWIPAPNQLGDCGKGRTILYRKIFKKTPVVESTSPIKKKIPAPAITHSNQKKINSTETHKYPQTTKTIKNNSITIKPADSAAKSKAIKDSVKEHNVTVPLNKLNDDKIMTHGDYKPRVKSLIKTLDIQEDKIVVDFYDNGAVDGDSITVFFNGKIVVSHLGLTEKPASFTLSIDKSLPYNELVMYAENMGTIPPNTALMVVKDGTKEYEVNITSDTERSGTIRFRYKPK